MMSGSTSNLGPPQGSQIYIKYLPIGTKSKHITELCKHFGELSEMEIIDCRHNCNALVTFFTKDAAKTAVADLHKKEHQGKQLCCTLSTPSNLLFLWSIPTGMTEFRLKEIISKMGRGFKKLKKFGLDSRNQPYNYAIVKYHNMDCANYSLEKMLEQDLELDGKQTVVTRFHPGHLDHIPYLTQEEKKICGVCGRSI